MSKRRKVGQIEKPPVSIDIESPQTYGVFLNPYGGRGSSKLELVRVLYGKPSVFVTHRPELLPQNGAKMYFTGLPDSGRDWVRERFLRANDEIERRHGPSWSLLDLDYSKLEERAMQGLIMHDEASHYTIDSLSALAGSVEYGAKGPVGPPGEYREKPPLHWKHDFTAYAKSDTGLVDFMHKMSKRMWLMGDGRPRVSDWHHDFLLHQLAADPVPMIRIHGEQIVPATRMMQDWLRKARAVGLPVAHEYAKDYMRRVSPSVYVLMNAAWQAGYTCNGINP